MQRRTHILEVILCEMKLGARKLVNCNKVKEIIQRQEKSPIPFYDRLEEGF
jgi:hypothetical protein